MTSGNSISGRERLLEAIVEHLADRGTHDLTLRGLASAIGTSHRMLNYHFGSRDGVLVAVAREVEERQRQGLADLMADVGASPIETMWAMYERLADPKLRAQERLFFDLYNRAVQADPDAEPLLDGVVETWVQPLVALFTRLGFDTEDAAAEARLAIAVARGLLLDLLATEDRPATDRAMKRYIARYAETSSPAGRSR